MRYFRVSKNIARNLIEGIRVHVDQQQRTTGVPLELKVRHVKEAISLDNNYCLNIFF